MLAKFYRRKEHADKMLAIPTPPGGPSTHDSSAAMGLRFHRVIDMPWNR